MIRYTCSRQQLESELETESPGWLADTAQRTAKFVAAQKFSESKSIWSRVKPVYMRRKGGQKCAFCERKLESQEFGAGEQAVEHFRPKGRVSAWKVPAQVKAKNIAVAAVPASQNGYYWLAYHPFNYTAACHPCNTSLKGDRFPIAGQYAAAGDPTDLLAEQPLLIYPLGDFDDDPESLLEFNGASPVPKHPSGTPFDRAFVTIEFFHLDDAVGRGNLFKERARIICALQGALDVLAGGPTLDRKTRAESLLQRATRDDSPHANCARSFLRLAKADPAAAARIADQAAKLDASSS